MTTALVILSIIVLAQMAVIYGLVNRLMRQSGHAGMSATSLLKEAEKLIIETNKDDTPKKSQGRGGLKDHIGSVPLELEVPENYGKVSLNIADYKRAK